MIAGFTAGERDYIRRELDIFFSTLPSVAGAFTSRPGAGTPMRASRCVARYPTGWISRRKPMDCIAAVASHAGLADGFCSCAARTIASSAAT